MIQPTRVLPSNAPPLQEGFNVHTEARVLQEHSGNRQQNDLGFLNDYEQKYTSTVLTENSYPRHHHEQPQQQAQHLYHPQPQHPQSWRYVHGRGGYPYPSPEVEARIQYHAERLYRRFRQSDQYNKYRARQSKDDKGNGDQKWPDHLEKAFFRALIQYPPMGRRKQLHKDKQRGRNELIADCIQELTGEARSRKQVSSHIQVLKPFVENDPLIMKWLSKDDMGIHAPRGGHGHASAYGGGRRMSNYPVTAAPQALRTAMPTLSLSDPYTFQKVKANLDVFEPVDFQMFVQRKYIGAKGNEEVERLHNYTRSVPNPLGPDLQMHDWQTIDRDFPLLSAMNAQRPIDCNILVAEASLAFPTETWKQKDGSPLPGVELGISFLCCSRHLPSTPKEAPSQVMCNNSFYENGVCIKEHSVPTEVRFEPSYTSHGNVETQIKFGSTFWAKTLGRLALRLLDTTKDQKDDVASSIRSITAVQEVFVRSEYGQERLLIIHWTFRQSTSICGRASWRKLLLPPSELTQYGGPVKPERSDSVFDGFTQYADASASQHQDQEQTQPTLQSPFEYESSSGSALSSATWPTSISDGSIVGQPIVPNWSAENSFDFNSGNINLAYDPNLNFDNFDSSAFNFDTSTADFAADPALQDYSQPWCDGQANGLDGQQIIENAGYGPQPGIENHGTIFDNSYGGHYDRHSYGGTHDAQAYEGAGQEIIKDEDALAALADASYMASVLGQKQAVY